jgi:hypothetical protein
MKNLLSIAAIAAIAAVMLDGASAAAAELPTFELMGFPISPHQVQVVGATHIQERSPTSAFHVGRYACLASSASSLNTARENNRDGGRKSDQGGRLASLNWAHRSALVLICSLPSRLISKSDFRIGSN